jgi:SpoVK/Ycf46/Vps4 family AAA+-type ATPase
MRFFELGNSLNLLKCLFTTQNFKETLDAGNKLQCKPTVRYNYVQWSYAILGICCVTATDFSMYFNSNIAQKKQMTRFYRNCNFRLNGTEKGNVDWSSIGGLESVKRALVETVLWPGKVSS